MLRNKILPEFLKKELKISRYLKELICTAGILFILCGATVFLTDPYMYFHKAWKMEQYFDNAYAMIGGVLAHCEYDTVLFGSSMCQNFTISEINQTLSCRAVKATAPGLSADAFHEFFRKAHGAGNGRFRCALIGLDLFTYAKDSGPWKEYAYLYKESLFPAEYLFSTDSLHACWEMLRKNIRYCFSRKAKDPKMDFNTMFFYRERPQNYGKEPLENNVRSGLNNPPPGGEKVRKNLERFLFSHIRKNPQIRFEIFLVPYHLYYYCTLEDQKKLESHLADREFLAVELARFPNVRLHDFQAELPIMTEEKFYKDITHYKKEINLLLLKKIRDYSAPGTPEKVRMNSGIIREKVRSSLKKFQKIQNIPAE